MTEQILLEFLPLDIIRYCIMPRLVDTRKVKEYHQRTMHIIRSMNEDDYPNDGYNYNNLVNRNMTAEEAVIGRGSISWIIRAHEHLLHEEYVSDEQIERWRRYKNRFPCHIELATHELRRGPFNMHKLAYKPVMDQLRRTIN